MNLWRDRVAVVTGGAAGIGAAVARLGSREGGVVWVLDVADGSHLEAADSGVIRYLRADVTDESEVAGAVAAIVAESGRVDILVNAAGRDGGHDPVVLSRAGWDDLMALDLTAPWLVARAVLPGMLERARGCIVNIGSLHGLMTAEGAFPYGAAKAGLAGLTRSLALETGPRGVRVNTVTPGWTLSERVAAALAVAGAEHRRDIEQRQPLRRLGAPEEIAAVVVFIASDEASFVTGANWIVDGGLSARFA